MTFTDLLNQYSFVAWILVGLFSCLIVFYIAKLLIVGFIKRAKKKAKHKIQKVIEYRDRVLDADLIPIKNLDKAQFYYKADIKDYFAKKGSFFLRLFDIRGYLDRRKKRKYPDKTTLIRMEMDNGMFREFVVREDEKEGFKHRGKKYLFDLDAKYYVIDSKMWAYDYHESFVLPVKRRIPVNKLKSTMEHSNITEVENAVNPVTLERFVKSEIAQGILQGATIGRLFKVMLIMLIIGVIVVGIDFVVDLYDSGIIQTLIEKSQKK